MKKLISLFVLSLIFLSACKQNTEPQPPKEEHPQGYQEGIPWASLAESPWPMPFADPQGTCRTKSFGATKGIRKVVELPQREHSALVLGKDSTIYYASAQAAEGDSSGLVALTPEGKVKWIFPIKNHWKPEPGNPIVRNDGVILTASPTEEKFYAIKPDGSLLWKVDEMPAFNLMNIGKDGTIYCESKMSSLNYFFNAISSKGEILWNLPATDWSTGTFKYAITPDGKNALFFTGGKLKSFNLDNKTFDWETEAEFSGMATMTDSQGDVYILGNQKNEEGWGVFKFDHTGKLLWKYLLPQEGWSAMALNEFGDCIAARGDTLYSIDFNGKLKWKTPLPSKLNGWISIDGRNNIYFAVTDSYDSKLVTYLCYDKEGNKVWETSGEDNEFYGFEYPCVPAYGKTYFLSYGNNKLVIIE